MSPSARTPRPDPTRKAPKHHRDPAALPTRPPAKSSSSRATGHSHPPSDRPFIRLNLAITADGKIATANRAISSFGSRRDLLHLYELREQADAILCGATTINAEDADLGPGPNSSRVPRSTRALPLRVVVSGRGSVDPGSRLFRRPFGPIIILTTESIAPARLRRLKSLVHTVHVCGANEVDFPVALRWLRSEWKVRQLLCEGGSRLNASLLDADLVDEIQLTLCPWIIGGRKALTLADGVGVAHLADVRSWGLLAARRIRDELFLIYRRRRSLRLSRKQP